METTKQVLAKLNKAKEYKDNKNFQTELEDAYRLCCPRRYNKDANPEKEIFDNTANFAVQSRVAANHDSLFPAFREWIGEEAVSKIDKAEELIIAKQIEARLKAAHKAVELSNFHIEIEDTLTDTMFSDGAILVFAGTPECPLHFQAVNWFDFYTLNDMDGIPNNNFLRRELTTKEIKYYWPEADLSDFADNKEDKKMQVIDAYTYDEITKKYTYSVMIGEKRIFAAEQDSSPWVIFNQKRKAIGKLGYGPVLDTMPEIRTANKIQEYSLQHASLSISGMWQVDDDGTINPDNISLYPGCIIPKAVGSQGLQPLVPKIDMDLSQFTLSEQKENIKKAVQGSALPNFSDGVRTAQEYQMRDAELKKTEIPIMLQLAQGSKRLMKRIFDILESDQMKASNMYCKKVKNNAGKEIQTAFTSPLIRMKEKMEMSNNLQILAIAAQTFGQVAYEVVDADVFLRDFLLKNGFSAEKIREGKKLDDYRQQNRQERIEMAQAGVKDTRPNPNNVSLSQPI